MSLTRLQSRLALPVVLIAGSLALAAPAAADIGETIILRCTHAQSLSGFSQSAYNKALKELSADSEEYSNCASQIRQAQLAAAAQGHGSSSSGSPAGSGAAPLAATPAEQRAISRAANASPSPVRVGGQTIRPGVVHTDIASALSSLPGPLRAALEFLIACLLLLAGLLLRNRFRGRHTD
jgi:hypothetical protein